MRGRIEAACNAAGRDPRAVTVVAVSKAFTPEAIREAVRAGQRDFGESYAQEGAEKIHALSDERLVWHYIGPIQSNKTGTIARDFDWVHAVDREKIARRLSEARDAHRPALKVCIQVNVSGEATKSGVAPDAVAPLARCVAGLPRLELRGLMAIPEPTSDIGLARRRFAQLREIREGLAREGLALDALSMGMSTDFESAIAEGATLVRVGTAVFGERAR